MIEGHDVSKWQPDEFHVEGIDFVIIQATKGLVVNPRLQAQTEWARDHGLSVGFYHYALDDSSLSMQADLFIRTAPLKPGDHLWFDWERDGITCAEKDEWIKYVQRVLPAHRVGLYCNGYFWGTKDTTGFYGDGLWIASYAAGEPAIKTNWLIHQYSDQGGIDKDRARFDSRAAMKEWALGKETPVTLKGPQKIPFASQAAFYGDKYKGSAMEVNVGVIHTTEGKTLPTYADSRGNKGASAPNVTGVPDFKTKTIKWYQHFDVDRSSRALVNASGGVETNTLNAFQVELVGTCDPKYKTSWGTAKAGVSYIFWPTAPEWALAEVAKLVRWLADNHGMKRQSTVKWKAYPDSYGKNGVRLSNSAWNAYNGWLGHQHVPENVHGDPGNINIDRILVLAGAAPTTGGQVDTPAKEVDVDAKALLTADNIIESPAGKGSTNEYWTLATYERESYLKIQALEAKLVALENKLDAVLAAVISTSVPGTKFQG